MPKLRSLPIDGSDETSYHGTCACLDPRQAEVANFSLTLAVDEDIRRFALSTMSGYLLERSRKLTSR
jgi:hypothetical protein